MTHPLSKYHHDISDIGKEETHSQNRLGSQSVSRDEFNKKMQEWADDMRKTDERCENFRN